MKFRMDAKETRFIVGDQSLKCLISLDKPGLCVSLVTENSP
jgi:hypothetical protein